MSLAHDIWSELVLVFQLLTNDEILMLAIAILFAIAINLLVANLSSGRRQAQRRQIKSDLDRVLRI